MSKNDITISVVFILVVGIISAIYILDFSDDPDVRKLHVKNSFSKAPVSLEEIDTAVGNKAKTVEIEHVEDSDLEEVNYIEAASYPSYKVVAFPNGQSVEVKYELTGALKVPQVTSSNIEYYFKILQARVAEGDPSAAVQLYDNLGRCIGTPRTEAELRSSTERLRVSGDYLGQGKFDTGAPSQLETAEQGLTLLFRSCQHVTDKDLEERQFLFEMAVEHEEPQALMRKAQLVGNTDPIEAFHLYETIWNNGESRAASDIARAYKLGLAPGLNGTPDLIKAHAFQLIHSSLTQTAILNGNSPHINEAVAALQSELNVSSSNLSFAELRQAENMAVKLLKENKKCCTGLWTAF